MIVLSFEVSGSGAGRLLYFGWAIGKSEWASFTQKTRLIQTECLLIAPKIYSKKSKAALRVLNQRKDVLITADKVSLTFKDPLPLRTETV